MNETSIKIPQIQQNFGVWNAQSSCDSLVWDAAMHAICGLDESEPRATLDQLLSRVADEHRQSIALQVQRSLCEHSPLDIAFHAVHPDGEVRHIVMRGSVWPDSPNGKPVHSGVCIDVTELSSSPRAAAIANSVNAPARNAPQQDGASSDVTADMLAALMMDGDRSHAGPDYRRPSLSRSASWPVLERVARLATVGELVLGVSHDVANGLNTVINGAQLVLDGDDCQLFGRMVLDEGERLVRINSDIVEFARCDTSRPVATAITDVVCDTIRLLEHHLQLHGIRVIVETADGLPTVDTRPHRLKQVLVNLLINARDSLLEPNGHDVDYPTIEVRAIHGTSPDYPVLLTVRDNGHGVPSSLLDQIMEPCFTTRAASGGTGLGVSISRHIIEMCGGRLEVASHVVGCTEFRIALPRRATNS